MEINIIFSNIFRWLFENKIEIFGLVSALAYLYFSIKQNVLLWPLGLISAFIYIYIYFNVNLYADMGLQVYYVIISVYGWGYWANTKNNNSNENETSKVQFTDLKTGIFLFFTTVLIFIFIAFILKNYTNSDLPYWDALTTSAGITATWMLARKYIEHWILWVIIDSISMGMYIYKELYITALLFIIYTAMAVVGYIQWKNSLNLKQSNVQ